METKDELITNVKEWIKMEGEINKMQAEIKEKKNKKKILTESLMNVMKKNDIDCFDITGGSLIYKKNKVKKPITAKTLISTLQSYFSSSPSKAEEVTKFILENREEKIKKVIKHRVDK